MNQYNDGKFKKGPSPDRKKSEVYDRDKEEKDENEPQFEEYKE